MLLQEHFLLRHNTRVLLASVRRLYSCELLWVKFSCHDLILLDVVVLVGREEVDDVDETGIDVESGEGCGEEGDEGEELYGDFGRRLLGCSVPVFAL